MSQAATPVDISQWFPRKTYTIVDETLNTFHVKLLSKEETSKLYEFVNMIKGDFPEDAKDLFFLIRMLKGRKWDLKAADKTFRKRMVRCYSANLNVLVEMGK